MLGPLEVAAGDRLVDIGRNRQRTTLALLLARRNQTVSTHQLVQALWEDRAPRTAVKQVQSCVWRLRALLQPIAGQQDLIQTTASGYCLRIRDDQVDTGVFERHTDDARTLAERGEHAGAAARLRAALALFRGPVLAEIDSSALEGVIARWEERRLVTIEECTAAELAAGRHRDVVDELRALVVEFPFREALRSQLMLALYRCGRQADALAAFQDGRESMIGELGVEPGPGLRDLHGAILQGDVAPDSPNPVSATVPTPSQLPPDTPDFVERPEHIAALMRTLAPAGDGLRVCAVTGRCGAGKSTLAVHVAHRLADRYPDGQLYADLAGSRATPANLDAIQRGFLHALGIPDPQVPADPAECTAMYRSALAGKRVLVVLDDVADPAQVEALTPTGPDTGVLLTSRTSPTGVPGVDTVSLAGLTEQEALNLLASVAGAERVHAEPDAARRIVHACGLLPLAVRAAGARLAARPQFTLAHFVRRLRVSERRLDELTHGDLDLRARLAPVIDRLAPSLRELFLVLGLCCGPDRPIHAVFGAPFAARAAGRPLAVAERALDRLVDHHLVDVAGLDGTGETQYRMHPLIGRYALERALAELPGPARAAVVERVMALTAETWANLPETLRHTRNGGRKAKFG